MRRRGVAAVGLLVTLGLSGCAAGSHASSSSATGSAAGGAATTSAGTGTVGTATAGAGTGTSGTGTASSGTGTATTTAGSSTPGRHRHRGKGGNGLPAAPSGLAQTTGYATYERCAGTCAGSVPASLRRPLHLPSDDSGPCPITLNTTGPASPRELPSGVGFHSVGGSPWPAATITWAVGGSYSGPLLIRGEMLGGGAAVGFGTATTPYDELQLLDGGQGAPAIPGGGRAWVTEARVQSSGCYAYQVDGTDFSEVVVFRAIA
jgi:hypothetical protein